MSLTVPHPHIHNIHRTGWLRAAVLGANDGIISTASLILGIAATQPTGHTLLISGVAAVIAGALSMAAGEYVSVAAQSDIEQADLAREQQSLIDNPEFEHQELLELYQARGLTPTLAEQVATQLMAHDALAAHAKDELGLHDLQRAQPLLAAGSSALSFLVGGLLPLWMVWLMPNDHTVPAIIATSLGALIALGWLSAYTGGTNVLHAIVRVAVFGALAMLITYTIGHAVGQVL
jgi:VIT1/CCC1 family predicted Fe2+/Mn2+ transporter